MKKLGEIRQRVAFAKRRRRQPDERTDIRRETILGRAIVIDVRLRLRPRSVEQCDEPVMEDVEEAAQRRVAGLAHPLTGVLSDVQRQRTVGTKQPEQAHL